MNIDTYAKMVNAVDSVRNAIGDVQADAILETMENTYNIVEDYCLKNIEGFSVRGKVVADIKNTAESISHSIRILFDGRDLSESEQSKHAVAINELLTQSYNEVGWEESENED